MSHTPTYPYTLVKYHILGLRITSSHHITTCFEVFSLVDALQCNIHNEMSMHMMSYPSFSSCNPRGVTSHIPILSNLLPKPSPSLRPSLPAPATSCAIVALLLSHPYPWQPCQLCHARVQPVDHRPEVSPPGHVCLPPLVEPKGSYLPSRLSLQCGQSVAQPSDARPANGTINQLPLVGRGFSRLSYGPSLDDPRGQTLSPTTQPRRTSFTLVSTLICTSFACSQHANSRVICA
jgi:hypothetical protein